jgi:hypothetical protein
MTNADIREHVKEVEKTFGSKEKYSGTVTHLAEPSRSYE